MAMLYAKLRLYFGNYGHIALAEVQAGVLKAANLLVGSFCFGRNETKVAYRGHPILLECL